MWQDLRYGVRMLAKSPGFTLVAVLTLALGVGANTTVFSVVNAVLLRPLPYPGAERLVRVWGNNPHQGSQLLTVSLPDYLDWSHRNQVFEQVAAFSFVGGSGNLVGGDQPERVTGLRVSAGLFPMLGAEVALGRRFLPEDERAGAEPVVVLSHRLWAARFGSDRNIIGRAVTLSGRSYTVAGVLPSGFQHPGIGGASTDIWLPLATDAKEWRRDFRHLQVLARLKPGVGIERAREAMRTLARGLEEQHPETNAGYGAALVPLHEAVSGNVRPALLILWGAVGFVLLIACANVANLLLARAAARQKEMTVRLALGASRWRLTRQLLTESLLLSLLGGAAGLLLTGWGMDLLVALSADTLPRASQIAVDGRVLGFTLGVSILTGLLFGLVPALQASRLNLQDSLKASGATTAAVFRRSRLRGFLIIAESALALVLLIGAGLLIKSFLLLRRVDPGLDPHHLVTMRVALPAFKYPKGQRMVAFYRELIERVAALPGVRSAAVVSWLPMSGQQIPARLAVEGQAAPPPGKELSADYRVISPGYFRTVGASLRRGRELSERDSGGAPVAVVINEAMADRFWPRQDPLGKRLAVELGRPIWCEVVGVIGEIKEFGLNAAPAPVIYGSYLQPPWSEVETRELVVRTVTDPRGLVAALRGEVWAMDKDIPVYNINTMREILSGATAQPRFLLVLLTLFAVTAFVLAAAGLYAVMSYSVAQRVQEIGIRLALGARAGDVLRLVIGQGMKLAGTGVGIGLAVALGVTRLMKGLLFGVGPADPLTFAAVAVLLTAVASVACYVPARRATRVDPLIALRSE